MKKLKYPLITILSSILLTGPASAEMNSFSDEQICKATIAFLMVQKPAIMSTKASGDEVIVTYKRPSDGDIFINKCKIDRSKKLIVWAAKFDTEWGRWRNHPLDPVISYSINEEKITIDEDGFSKTYMLKDL